MSFLQVRSPPPPKMTNAVGPTGVGMGNLLSPACRESVEPELGERRPGRVVAAVPDGAEPERRGDLDEHLAVFEIDRARGLGLGDVQSDAENVLVRLPEVDV